MDAGCIVRRLLEDDFDPEEVEQIASTPRTFKERLVASLKDLVIRVDWVESYIIEVEAFHSTKPDTVLNTLKALDDSVFFIHTGFQYGYRTWVQRFGFMSLRSYTIHGRVQASRAA